MCPRAASQSHWCGYRLWAYFMLSERKLDFCISSWLWFLGFGKSSTWHETLANDEVTSKREEFLLAVESAHLLVRAWFNGENSCNLWSISNILFAHTGTSQNVGVNTSRLHVCQAHYCVCVCVCVVYYPLIPLPECITDASSTLPWGHKPLEGRLWNDKSRQERPGLTPWRAGPTRTEVSDVIRTCGSGGRGSAERYSEAARQEEGLQRFCLLQLQSASSLFQRGIIY